MKVNKSLFAVLSIFMILLIFISSASAADANETGVISIDKSVDLENNNALKLDSSSEISAGSNDSNVLENNNQILQAPNSNDWHRTFYINSSANPGGDGSEGNPYKSLNDALNDSMLKNNNIIMIASGTYTGENNTNLTINKNLYFEKYGDGEAIFDAEGLSRIWNVNATSINITGLTFKNGKADKNYGGAIYIAKTLINSNINATFINNTATNGGAIYINGDVSGTLTGSFNNNTAENKGGAIYIDSSVSGNLTGSFNNNTATNGGAIYINGGVSGTLTGSFINNTAGYGGAIYISKNGVFGSLNGSFINNRAIGDGGGAIHIDAGDVSGTLIGSFINNTESRGGAIFIYGGFFGCLNGSFINNTVGSTGSAIYFNSILSGTLTGSFINNIAKNDSSAIYINDNLGENAIIKDSIFINNKIISKKGNITVINSWFGNNATNYNTKPTPGNVIMDNWLFLTADANPTVILINQTSKITFKLDSYNETSKKVTPYDTSKINISLDLTQTLGQLNQTATLIGKEVLYTAKQEGNAGVTAKFENVSHTINLKNNVEPEINVLAENVTKYYNGTEQFIVNVTDKTGKGIPDKTVFIILNGVTYDKTTDENGTAYLNINLPSGNYTANVTVDDISIKSTIIVKTTIAGHDIISGFRNVTYDVWLVDSEGNALENGTAVEFNINGRLYRGKVIGNNTASVNLILNTGNYTITTINPKTNEKCSNRIIINAKTLNVTITTNPVSYYEPAVVEISGLANATGYIFATYLDQEYFYRITGNTQSFETLRLTDNTTLTVSYLGNNEYNSFNKTAELIVYPRDSNITIVASDYYVNNSPRINVRFPASPHIEGNLTVILNNESRTIDLEDAEIITVMGWFYVIVRYENLTIGNYTVDAFYSGDDHYLPSNATAKFSVLPKENITMTINVSSVTEGQNITIDVILPKDAILGNVTATVDGKNFTASVVSSDVKIIIPDLAAGNYTVPVTYSGNFKYNSYSQDVNITVYPKSDVVIVAENVTKYYGGPERFVANIYDSEGNPLVNKSVNITINGITYTRTSDDNGTVSMAIRLGSGTYDVTTQVDNTTLKSSITVLSTVIGSDITKYYKNATQYSVKVYNTNGTAVGKGEVVTFNINGIFYNRTTDENGIATLNINLPSSNYIITSDYKGCRIANNITVLPVLNATDISMKYLDGTQFKVNLVDGQGKPYKDQFVRFNINGKFYDRLTDSNGQAALNIRLPPGEYIITSSFNGANIANKITITG